jgi:hypothetical protein
MTGLVGVQVTYECAKYGALFALLQIDRAYRYRFDVVARIGN